VGGDWRDLAAGGIDVAFVCSPPLVWLKGAVEAIAAPVFIDQRFGGRPLYCSDVIVPASSAATSFDDLAGARWAVNESSSWSGYWVTLARVGDWSYFGDVLEAGFHQAAIRLVSMGRVDGAAIDSQVLAFELHEHPDLRQRVKVIDSFPPAPSQPVVVRAGIDEALKQQLAERLRSLRGPLLERYGFRRFAAAPDYSFAAAVVEGRRISRAEPQWLQKP
jgi:ABC-type phosphate/phosphonate transport system substrate-binding protein